MVAVLTPFTAEDAHLLCAVVVEKKPPSTRPKACFWQLSLLDVSSLCCLFSFMGLCFLFGFKSLLNQLQKEIVGNQVWALLVDIDSNEGRGSCPWI